MSEIRTIYGLYDPLEPDVVRYIGQTKKRLHVRMSEHVADTKRGQCNHRCNWIRWLLRDGRTPVILPLATCSVSDVEAVEIEWIATHRATLTNTTAGGEGSKDMSPEVIQKILESRKWYKHSDETCRKISYAKKGKPLSDSNLAALRVSNSKPRSEAHKAKLGAARKAAPVTEDTRKKISEAGKAAWSEGRRTIHENTIAVCKTNAEKQRGVPLSDTHRANVGAASRKAVRTPEWKAAISAAVKLHWEKRRAAKVVL